MSTNWIKAAAIATGVFFGSLGVKDAKADDVFTNEYDNGSLAGITNSGNRAFSVPVPFKLKYNQDALQQNGNSISNDEVAIGVRDSPYTNLWHITDHMHITNSLDEATNKTYFLNAVPVTTNVYNGEYFNQDVAFFYNSKIQWSFDAPTTTYAEGSTNHLVKAENVSKRGASMTNQLTNFKIQPEWDVWSGFDNPCIGHSPIKGTNEVEVGYNAAPEPGLGLVAAASLALGFRKRKDLEQVLRN